MGGWACVAGAGVSGVAAAQLGETYEADIPF